MKYRLIGVVILIVSIVIGYVAIVDPVAKAQAGAKFLTDGSKIIALLPLACIFSFGLLLGGERFFKFVTKDNGKFTAAGWCFLIGGIALGTAIAVFWYDDLIHGLGYRRLW